LIVFLAVAAFAPPPEAGANDIGVGGPPVGQLTFRVKWDGRYITGVTKINGLMRRTEVAAPRSGGDPSMPRRAPGLTSFEPLVLERPLTSDVDFERWANKVWNFGSGLGSEVSLRDFRKDIIIELFNDLDQKVMAFQVFRCWPSDYVVMGDMNAESPSVPIEALVLQYEGWERDRTVVAP
jgi:phage tail-like protein